MERGKLDRKLWQECDPSKIIPINSAGSKKNKRLLFWICSCKEEGGGKKKKAVAMLICPLLWTVWKTCVHLQQRWKTTALLKTALLPFHCQSCKSARIEQLVVNLSSGWYRCWCFSEQRGNTCTEMSPPTPKSSSHLYLLARCTHTHTCRTSTVCLGFSGPPCFERGPGFPGNNRLIRVIC